MVINEKGLIRAMKEAYKGAGYKVAADDSGGVEEIMIGHPNWVAVIEKKNIPRKVLGLIAEHVGTIPEPGQAYQVSKKETQTQIFSVAMQLVEDLGSDEKVRRQAKPSRLVLGGYRLWQREQDLRVVRVDPDLENIMCEHGRTCWMFDDDTLMVDGKASRVYIKTFHGGGEDELLQHLSKVAWVSFEK